MLLAERLLKLSKSKNRPPLVLSLQSPKSLSTIPLDIIRSPADFWFFFRYERQPASSVSTASALSSSKTGKSPATALQASSKQVQSKQAPKRTLDASNSSAEPATPAVRLKPGVAAGPAAKDSLQTKQEVSSARLVTEATVEEWPLLSTVS